MAQNQTNLSLICNNRVVKEAAGNLGIENIPFEAQIEMKVELLGSTQNEDWVLVTNDLSLTGLSIRRTFHLYISDELDMLLSDSTNLSVTPRGLANDLPSSLKNAILKDAISHTLRPFVDNAVIRPTAANVAGTLTAVPGNAHQSGLFQIAINTSKTVLGELSFSDSFSDRSVITKAYRRDNSSDVKHLESHISDINYARKELIPFINDCKMRHLGLLKDFCTSVLPTKEIIEEERKNLGYNLLKKENGLCYEQYITEDEEERDDIKQHASDLLKSFTKTRVMSGELLKRM